MLVIDIQWVMALGLLALIGGIIAGVSLVSPRNPEMPVRRQQREEPPRAK